MVSHVGISGYIPGHLHPVASLAAAPLSIICDTLTMGTSLGGTATASLRLLFNQLGCIYLGCIYNVPTRTRSVVFEIVAGEAAGERELDGAEVHCDKPPPAAPRHTPRLPNAPL